MGGSPSKSEDLVVESLKRLEQQRIEREIAFKEILCRRERAYQLALEREKFLWTASSAALFSGLLIANAYTSKNYNYLSVLPAVAGYVSYHAHLCYGSKLEVVSKLAETIWKKELDDSVIYAISPDDVKRRRIELHTYRKENDDLFST